MFRPTKLIGCMLMAACLVPAVQAQRLVVEVETNLPEAIVYADSVRVGVASAGSFSVPATTRFVRLVPERVDAWTLEPVAVAVPADAGDTLRVRLDFPYYYVVETVPFGATVVVEQGGERQKLGTTPLRYRADAPLDGTLLIERPGFVTERLDPGADVLNRHVLTLRPPDREGAEEVAWRPPPQGNRWFDYAALGVGVAAGALAVHYKFKANNRYDRYVDLVNATDPSPEALAEAQRYYDASRDLDLQSGIALGVMQVGVGFFAVRLALR